MYKFLFKPILFLFSPEKAHHLTILVLKLVTSLPGGKQLIRYLFSYKHEELPRDVMGLRFNNPIGLAAGFDKNGELIREFEYLGFGFIEIGTITPKPQKGNEKPRLFRLPKDNALINRMGFNNEGVVEILQNVKKTKSRNIIVGGNIGKNKRTPNSQAIDDYLSCFYTLYDDVDYFAINVSSPNTPNLRDLQSKEPLTELLTQLQQANHSKPFPKPILLKVAPDLSKHQLEDIVDIVSQTKISGVIATNTTISRSHLQTKEAEVNQIGLGGLSGEPLKDKSTELIRFFRKHLDKDAVIIGVGGIHDVHSAREKINAGANLLQLYSGLVYEGPSLVKRINRSFIS